MIGRIPVTEVRPVVDGGRWPAKAIVGETVPVTATVFREGHDAVGVTVVAIPPTTTTTTTTPSTPSTPSTPRRRTKAQEIVARMRPLAPGTDRWQADITLPVEGDWTIRVEGWSDPVGTWRHDAQIKIPLGLDVELVCEEGARVYERAAAALPRAKTAGIRKAVAALRDAARDPMDRIALALDPDLTELMDTHPLRDLVTAGETYRIRVERERAGFSAWYEFFPRSVGAVQRKDGSWRSGTFTTAAQRLPAIKAMGFDVVYLPPIHPIGTSYRKGPNNTLDPTTHDPGSPWAIGGPDGGHDAIHPDLGTFADFDAFVATAARHSLEVALDLALQCSPDHPWVTEHPEWFTIRVDGTIAYAENPPKAYQDIYPINFDNDPEGIRAAVLDVVLLWISHGVRIFRVDNPHTKPVEFWEWLIEEVRTTHPGVIWLAEAFTRPAMLQTLGKIGFTQSYTYFTWRTERWEIEAYLTELTQQTVDYLRPNFFVNTPDILHASLQYGGPAMFKIRAVLAALSSPSWGVYSGYELGEHVAVRPGSEEYLDSEKYSYRPRDFAAAEAAGTSLAPYLALLNRVRRDHPAMRSLHTFHWHDSGSDQVLVWSRRAGDDTVIVVLTLDSYGARETTIHLDLDALGVDPGESIEVVDQVTGATFTWGAHNYVRLDPFVEPAHVLVVQRRPT
jgi:starch synthase (maltosyl-transferring)